MHEFHTQALHLRAMSDQADSNRCRGGVLQCVMADVVKSMRFETRFAEEIQCVAEI